MDSRVASNEVTVAVDGVGSDEGHTSAILPQPRVRGRKRTRMAWELMVRCDSQMLMHAAADFSSGALRPCTSVLWEMDGDIQFQMSHA